MNETIPYDKLKYAQRKEINRSVPSLYIYFSPFKILKLFREDRQNATNEDNKRG